MLQSSVVGRLKPLEVNVMKMNTLFGACLVGLLGLAGCGEQEEYADYREHSVPMGIARTEKLIAEAEDALRGVSREAYGSEKRAIDRLVHDVQYETYHSSEHIDRIRHREYERKRRAGVWQN